MTRSRVRGGFVAVGALLLALSACGGGSGNGDAGQTGGTTGAGGTSGVGGTTGTGGASGRGGTTGSGGAAGNACSSCNYAAQYCSVTVGGAVGAQPSYVCRDLPAGCGSNPTCTCLMGNVGCGNLCSQADGGITVTCQAP